MQAAAQASFRRDKFGAATLSAAGLQPQPRLAAATASCKARRMHGHVVDVLATDSPAIEDVALAIAADAYPGLQPARYCQLLDDMAAAARWCDNTANAS